ncbi:hypothetical protein CO038_02285 [Candidatus Pacearchaeota archaeon CG_4_9_14_0_2_um_filter_39_13]|nr:hypothetical protein [Candidatus Pacearchaeota archaeon]OIO43923.1 MAG: hypothetical protein AUJ64_01335 [Candidatus Pacearchaeota archaeon CG1_02_39_14]PJC44774.1 MAG: hypothetical protein CO038_02285 [Candidatus Pacearchaeota archaeon CG_4_9_14_0_2_um_filter_39_13]
MNYWRSVHLPIDVDERRRIVSGLEGAEVIVRDAVEKRGYGLQGRVALSGKGSYDFYFLRGDDGNSVPLKYSELKDLQVLVRFSSRQEQADEARKEILSLSP